MLAREAAAVARKAARMERLESEPPDPPQKAEPESGSGLRRPPRVQSARESKKSPMTQKEEADAARKAARMQRLPSEAPSAQARSSSAPAQPRRPRNEWEGSAFGPVRKENATAPASRPGRESSREPKSPMIVREEAAAARQAARVQQQEDGDVAPRPAPRSASVPARRRTQVRTASTARSRPGSGSNAEEASDPPASRNAKPLSVLKAEAAAARRAAVSKPPRPASSDAAPRASGDGLGERGDAAAMILRTMLGARGTSAPFKASIDQWREENPVAEWGVGAEFDKPPVADNGILVVVRVRPLLPKGPDAGSVKAGDFEGVSVLASGDEVALHCCGLHRDGISPHVNHKPFHVHAAYGGGCDERSLFSALMAPLVESAVEHSAHATVLCYGQTGAGKTHTQSRLADLTASHLFETLGATRVALEAFELSGSQAYSLQEDAKPELTLCEGRDGVVRLGGGRCTDEQFADGELPELCRLAVSAAELIALFRAASARRSAQDTARNAASSRSHAFYRLYLVTHDGTEETRLSCTGTCIELVDLAGSESNKDSLFHDRGRVEDAAKINSSLMALNDCIRKQSQAAGYVPFRADKLTLLLRPCFMKRVKKHKDVPTLLFIACMSPLATDFHQSSRTLGYSQQLSEMKARTRREAAEALKPREAKGLNQDWNSERSRPARK